MPRHVRLATWIAFVLHGFLVLTARYRLSYDAYNHMFFGDHYRLDWWSLWEPRWYTGFDVTSYPPLVHQLIGLLGRVLGVDAAFALLLWVVLTLYPLAVYFFCRAFTGRLVAGYAALGAAVLPSIYQAAHTFGQLPTLTGTLFALLAVAALNDFLRRGRWQDGVLAAALIGVVMAAHHATLLFLPWATGALGLHLLLNRGLGFAVLARRLLVFAVLAGALGLLVIWPFWAWGRGQVMQTPIDHPSRHNFFLDPLAPAAFFLPVYGFLIPLLPFAFWKGFQRRFLGLGLAFLGLFVLGLGGTTPLPQLIFGAGWQWLTYDRFAFWASLLLLPFLGLGLVLARKHFGPFLARVFMRRLRLPAALARARGRAFLSLALFTLVGFSAILSGLIATLMPTQPQQVDMQPIVDFLAQGDHSRWRYLTFGLGDQLAYLSRLTPATTIDGSYHTARSLPELRASGVGQVDTAYWLPNGLAMIDPILQKSGERGVRWGFVNRQDYIPVLRRNGWVQLRFLSNGVQLWENPRAVLPAPVIPPAEDPLAVFSWGVLPLAALLLALTLGTLRIWPGLALKGLAGLYFLAIGLLPLGLCFWYYQPVVSFPYPRVYFTYTDALFFASDLLAVLAVFAWLLLRAYSARTPASAPARRLLWGSPWGSLSAWLLGLVLLASLSTLWSQDWRISLALSLHLWLVFGLFLSLRDHPEAWRAFGLGSAAALFLQIALGGAQFAAQSSAFLQPLGLNWPGLLTAASPAASIVHPADGLNWLRVYGTLPHPNILGGLVFVFLAGTALLYLDGSRRPGFLLALGAAGLVLLVLTFSRSTWLASAVFVGLLGVHYRRFDQKRLLMLAGAGLLGLVFALVPFWQLVFARTGGVSASTTEDFSIRGRLWLMQASLQFIRERPLAGLGQGGFILALARRAGVGYIIEPVHNLALLITSELGLGGGLLFAGLALNTAWAAFRAGSARQVVLAGMVVGLFIIALFDHYLWTLAPGRVLLGLCLGLLAGQLRSAQTADP